MEVLKFGADLLVSSGRIGGHVFLTDNSFEWKPVFKFMGAPMSYQRMLKVIKRKV